MIKTMTEDVAQRCPRIIRTLLLVSSALLVMVVSPTISQAASVTLTYTTTGVFAGCDALGGGSGFTTCTEGNSILRYDFQPSIDVLLTDAVPSAVAYGRFQTFGDSVMGVIPFSGVTFVLNLSQTGPSVGSQNLVGSVTGTVDAQSGVVIWGPVAPTSWNINPIHWTIALDQNGPATGGILINPSGVAGSGGFLTFIGGTACVDRRGSLPTAGRSRDGSARAVERRPHGSWSGRSRRRRPSPSPRADRIGRRLERPVPFHQGPSVSGGPSLFRAPRRQAAARRMPLGAPPVSSRPR